MTRRPFPRRGTNGRFTFVTGNRSKLIEAERILGWRLECCVHLAQEHRSRHGEIRRQHLGAGVAEIPAGEIALRVEAVEEARLVAVGASPGLRVLAVLHDGLVVGCL